NRMLNQIEIKTQERDRAEIELKNLNDLLEERVRVRTQELAHANKLLSLYNESQKTILENLPYGLMLINQKQQIIEINQPALDLLGYQKDELQNTKCSLLGCNGNSTNCLLYSDELNQISHEIQLRKKNGDLVTALKNDSPIIYNNETIILETFVDISQLKETEKELIKAKQKAEESDRLKSSFLSNISHEIRTPLNSIIGFSQLLSITNEFSLQDRSKYQSLIRNGADELLALIDDIIDISELESSQCNIRKSNLKLNLLIDNIRQKTETIRKIYNKEYLATQYNIAPDLKDLTILTDQKRFTQIIMNLVSNALKFTENGSINISFKRMEENELLFKIKDTGIGIDSKYHAHVFERFFKIESGKNKLYRGSGLGLAISAGLVELLGGKIWLESEAGIGTTFFVILPIDSKPIITRQRAISLITDAINE
ncbi:MAG: PAS domain-containing sensor histidine kinase, partial [Bacteroidota bacterium]|nr:PAS domain-containing sensor histidine kinase [Bacteroidota bacterium]